MIICTEYQHLCISLSLWFSLLVVVGAIPRRGSWSTAGAGGRGWGLNVQQYYQVRSVLSGEIALAEGFFWTKVILTGFQVGEEEQLQQLPRGDLFPYIQQVNKPTHPQQIITTNTNELSQPHHDDVWRRKRWSWGASWTGWASPTTLRFSEKGWFLSIFLFFLHIHTIAYFPLDCSGSLGEGSRWVRWQVW